MLEPDDGEVTWQGRDIMAMSEAELRRLRPAAVASKGTLRETADGYAMIYVLNTAVPERSVTMIAYSSASIEVRKSTIPSWDTPATTRTG